MNDSLRSSLPEVLERVSGALYKDVPLDVILITVRHPETAEIAQFEQRRAGGQGDAASTRAIVSRPVLSFGRQIGQIELQAGPGKAMSLLRAAEALQDEIATALEQRYASQAA